ncbi:tyrosine-type recombinase/integrase [Mycobacterium avium]
MASVQKRTRADGRPVYVVKWREADGKERTKGGFPTKKLAGAYAIKQAEAKLRGLVFDPKAGGVTFREAAESWLDSRHDLKATTREGYRGALAPADKRRGDGRMLGIDAVFGGYPLNAITREQISRWVNRLVQAGKKPSTVRHNYFIVRMVLGQAVVDGWLPTNPADYVKLPTEHSTGGGSPAGVVDDPAQFLTAAQVSALVAATPWPYSVLVSVAAWSGLRAAELCGLQVGDVDLPATPMNPNSRPKPGVLRVERTAQWVGKTFTYASPKTKGSRRRVPMTTATTEMMREYLAAHPRGDEPTAPLFPGMALGAFRPTGLRAVTADGLPASRDPRHVANRQASALAELSVPDAEARLELDWDEPLRHMTFYKAVYRPAVRRANRLTPTANLSPELKFHSLRHTYASLCVAAGIPPLEIARFMGHSKVTTTLTVYAHLFEDDHADAMAALGAMGWESRGNVARLPRRYAETR